MDDTDPFIPLVLHGEPVVLEILSAEEMAIHYELDGEDDEGPAVVVRAWEA